ncbi:hypothetical protein RhiirC2_787357 [Rhizophagus irregularis]|uniref:RNase H type-1 domain-containing protein n=1 Tax=Rhizophagus irregularis TaxID=588596 RepID=A0A2N1MSE0_9GLOM|nr:hypothetical protein RhiirC2_787357 [Rhizophagus irregularis]
MARRFQKLNNCILWNTIKHIINTLKLKVSLFKVKAHSGHALNDAADLLVKDGISSKDFFQINIQYLPTQTCHLTFNDSIIIDHACNVYFNNNEIKTTPIKTHATLTEIYHIRINLYDDKNLPEVWARQSRDKDKKFFKDDIYSLWR